MMAASSLPKFVCSECRHSFNLESSFYRHAERCHNQQARQDPAPEQQSVPVAPIQSRPSNPKKEYYGLTEADYKLIRRMQITQRNIKDGPFMFSNKEAVRTFERLYEIQEQRNYKAPVSRNALQSVYYALCFIASDRSEQEFGYFSASYADIERKSDLSHNTVIAAVRMLEDLRFIFVEHFDRKKLQYTLTNIQWKLKE